MRIVADENIPFVAECFSSIGKVQLVAGREITSDVIADADILLVRSVTRVGADLLGGSRVCFVGTATIGFDHVDIEYLSRNNIGFASAPGSNANSAAEYVIAAMLEISRKHKITLEGKSIGIIGVGNVGSRVAKKAAALGMKVSLNDPPLQRQTGDPKYLPVKELFGCDFVTLHTPLTFDGVDKTFHLANDTFFKKSLKSGCVFINTSRGCVVDTSALKTAIKSDKLKAVALDVWQNEPNIDAGLLEMVDIGTPHIAGYSLDGKVAGMIMVYKAVCQHFGLEARWGAEDFLVEPAISKLEVDADSVDEQRVILGAVKQVYDISQDDRKLRGILEVDAERKGEFFDSLRNNYPVRREFQNIRALVKNKCNSLANKLNGIGFLLAQE
jgi:erythronate-4-phosphate dehydrogenase